MTLNPILQALQSLGGDISKFVSPPPEKLISPVPQSESPGGINDPTQAGLNAYYQREVGKEQAAGPSTFQPKTLQYPEQLANAPQQQVLATQTQQPQQSNPLFQAIQLANPKPQQAYAEGSPEGATPYEKKADKIFSQYDVPSAIGLGIWAMEGRGKTINPNNPYNIGAYDTNPQNANAYEFKDPLEGTEEAAKFLAGKSEFQTPDVRKVFQTALAQYKKDHDQNNYLAKIAPIYSTNPQYVQTVMQTPEYQRWSYNTRN